MDRGGAVAAAVAVGVGVGLVSGEVEGLGRVEDVGFGLGGEPTFGVIDAYPVDDARAVGYVSDRELRRHEGGEADGFADGVSCPEGAVADYRDEVAGLAAVDDEVALVRGLDVEGRPDVVEGLPDVSTLGDRDEGGSAVEVVDHGSDLHGEGSFWACGPVVRRGKAPRPGTVAGLAPVVIP